MEYLTKNNESQLNVRFSNGISLSFEKIEQFDQTFVSMQKMEITAIAANAV